MILLKIFLLCLYLVLLVALYRAVDFLTWSDAAGVATLVNPIDLSLRQLRWLLHARGVSYYGAIEKKDLSDLVSASGVVTSDEVKAAESLDSMETYDAVTFSSKQDLEAAMDNSEDVWLVQVVADKQHNIIQEEEWRKLTKHVRTAGIQAGQVFCQETPALCHSLSVSSSQLIVSNHYKKHHRGIHRKHYLTRKTEENAAFSWISHSVEDSIEEIQDLGHLNHDWLSSKSRKAFPVQLIYVSGLKRVPVMFASLEAKFRNRIRFGKFALKHDSNLVALRQLLNIDSGLPKAFVCLVTNHKIYIYDNGNQKGNFLHFSSLYLFLQTFNPDINLLFTLSIYLCNILASLSFFVSSGHMLARFIKTAQAFFIYNAVLLVTWLLLSSYKPKLCIYLVDVGLKQVQNFTATQLGGSLRQCTQLMLFKPYLVFLGFIIFFFVTVHFLRKLNLIAIDPASDTLADLLLLNENRSVGYNDISRRLVERLATPGLWLQPLVPSDYIENLPVWKYTGECLESSDDDSDCSVGTSTRTSSVSPNRAWASPCRDELRGRSCSSSRDHSSRLGTGLLRSLKSCFRGRSPRFKRTAGPPKGMREEQSCPVCLEHYKSHSYVCGLPCGHVYHHNCILQWLHSDRHCCPICRWPAYHLK